MHHSPAQGGGGPPTGAHPQGGRAVLGSKGLHSQEQVLPLGEVVQGDQVSKFGEGEPGLLIVGEVPFLPPGEPHWGAVLLLPQQPSELVAPVCQVLGCLPVHGDPARHRWRGDVLSLETEVSNQAQDRTNSVLPAQVGPKVEVEETRIDNTRSVLS